MQEAKLKLYDEFEDWYLALAGYNAGEGRVRRALARTGSRDFWKIARSTRHLRRETRNYVPAIIAATLIHKDPAKYGLSYEPNDPQPYESVDIEDAVTVSLTAEALEAQTDIKTPVTALLTGGEVDMRSYRYRLHVIRQGGRWSDEDWRTDSLDILIPDPARRS